MLDCFSFSLVDTEKNKMTVFVNHKEINIAEASNLDFLIEHLNLTSQGLALAIDNQVIPKNTWASFELSENMKVTVIKATQGG